MCRLLFLFHIEAHPNLRYAPLDADAYREGYGLERLRDLEMVRLSTEESLNGHHLHLSIEQLFLLVREGFHAQADLLSDRPPNQSGEPASAPTAHGFSMRPLDSRLFHPSAKPLLNQVKLHNRVLQQVIPRLKFVDVLAARHRFHHWELAFADVFAVNGGFDLVLGNPPWVKVEWEEGGVLGDRIPLFVLDRETYYVLSRSP